MFIGERFPSFFFPPDLPWKRYSGIETGHVQISNIFSHEKPRTFRLKKKKNETQKKEALNEKKNCDKDLFNSWYFRKYKRMKIQHQQYLLGKGNNFNNLGKKNFLWQTLFLYSSKAIFFFVKLVLLRSNNGYFVFRRGDEWLKMVKLLHLDCNRNSRKS